MKILITGFDPFGGESVNPAWEAVQKIPTKINNIEIVTEQIPTVFRESVEILLSAVEKHSPDIVLCIGQAGGRFELNIERVAINMDDARIPDNKGNQPLNSSIYLDGENAYFTNLPVKKMMQAVKDKGIPCSISYTAGTFVCNHIFYSLLYHINKKNINVQAGGFIHVPYLPNQVISKQNQPYMSTDLIVQGISTMIEVLFDGLQDIEILSGKIS